jgi:outer membrane protein W
MKRVLLSAVLAFAAFAAAAPAAAQVRMEAGFFGTWVHSTSRTVTDEAHDVAVEFRDGGGGGAFLDVRPWTIVSFEVSGACLRQSVDITSGGTAFFSSGRLEAYPVVLVAKFHLLGDGTFDPWIGGGESYTIFHDLNSPDLDAAGIGGVEVKNKFGLVAAAGFRIAFSKNVAFVADGKYLAVKPETQAAGTGVSLDLKWNPLLVSAGFGFRF